MSQFCAVSWLEKEVAKEQWPR